MEPNWEAAKVVVDVVQWLFTLAIGAYAWWVNKSRANRNEIGAINDRISDNARRIDSVEKDAKAALNHKDMQALQADISALRGDLRELSGAMESTGKTFSLVLEGLLNKGHHQ